MLNLLREVFYCKEKSKSISPEEKHVGSHTYLGFFIPLP